MRPSGLVVLTNALVESLISEAKNYDVRDLKIPGLYVRVHTSGIKSFRCCYVRGRHYTIGRFGALKVSDARQIAQRVIGDAARGIDPNQKKREARDQAAGESGGLTCLQFFEKIYASWYSATYPSSAKNTLRILQNEFMPQFGKKKLNMVTAEMLENWRTLQKKKRTVTRLIKNDQGVVERVQRPVTPATLNRYIERFSAFLSKAVEYGYLESNRIMGIKKLREPEDKRVRFLSPEEYAALLRALDERQADIRQKRRSGNQWRKARHKPLLPDLDNCQFVDHLMPMVLIALATGIRFNALSELQWERNVDMSNPESVVLNLNPEIMKMDKSNALPLDPDTSKILLSWYQQTHAEHEGKGWVFPGRNPGKHITSVKKSWKNLLAKAGIENFQWHDQRHDFASQHVMSGTDIYTLMNLLGHSSPKVTMRYAHVAEQHKVNAAKRLREHRDKLYRKESGK